MPRNHYRDCSDDCTTEHQLRERTVPCQCCQTSTLNLAAICDHCEEQMDARYDAEALA